MVNVPVQPIPSGSRALYISLAAVGIFSLLVGASVRLRRPEHQATLHFFWLSIAFFGVLTLSFSGRLDTLDKVFYWGDVVAMLMLPPLFVHFALMFPERPEAWARSETGRTMMPLLYLPALLLGGARRGGGRPCRRTRRGLLERDHARRARGAALPGREPDRRPGIMMRALRPRAVGDRHDVSCGGSSGARRSAPCRSSAATRCRSRSACIRLPGMELTAILLGLVPLAFASAIVRYRLMDVEVIIKRTLVYAAALAAIAAIYAVLLWLVSEVFFGGDPERRNPSSRCWRRSSSCCCRVR